jgi:hypothetical protein
VRLLTLQKELLQDYEGIPFQAETLWFQKSIENWIKLGSCNSSFFHAQTVVKRKRNKIHGRHISLRVWCTDPDILCTEAVILQGALGYQESFGGYDYHITHEEKASLTKAITKEEVYKALTSMKSYKLRVRTDSSLPSSKSSGMMWGMVFENRSNDH